MILLCPTWSPLFAFRGNSEHFHMVFACFEIFYFFTQHRGKHHSIIFRHSGGPSAKEETRTADGITRGSYSYIDGHGLVQTTSYVSDPVNGFRVAATNLPVGPSSPAAVVAAGPAGPLETPEVSFKLK